MFPRWVLNPDHTIRNLNADASDMVGRSHTDMVGLSIHDLVCGPDAAGFIAALERATSTAHVSGRWWFCIATGGSIQVELELSHLVNGEIIVSGSIECQEPESECDHVHDLFQQMMDASESIIYAYDLKGCCLLANRALANLFKTTTDQMIGARRENFLPETIARQHLDNDQIVIHTGKPLLFEEITEHPAGVHYYSSKKIPLFDNAGTLLGVGGISRNITNLRLAEQALSEQEMQWKALATIAPVGIFRTDVNGNCVYVNKHWCELSGLTSDQAQGAGWINALHQDDRQRVIDEWVRSCRENDRFDCEYRYVRADGTTKWILGQSTAVDSNEGGVVGYVGAVTDITILKEGHAALADAHRRIENLARRNMTLFEEERKHISRELHDEIGQTLTALKLSITRVRRKAVTMADISDIHESLDHSIALSDTLIDTLRNLARELRPPQLDDFGLSVTLRWYLDNLGRQLDTSFRFDVDIGDERFSPTIELAVFRIVQEAISNALRHSQAQCIKVSLRWTDRYLRVTVADDGIGFVSGRASPANKGKHKSLGLLGMSERAQSAGGQLFISSHPGDGTRIEVVFEVQPLEKQ